MKNGSILRAQKTQSRYAVKTALLLPFVPTYKTKASSIGMKSVKSHCCVIAKPVSTATNAPSMTKSHHISFLSNAPNEGRRRWPLLISDFPSSGKEEPMIIDPPFRSFVILQRSCFSVRTVTSLASSFPGSKSSCVCMALASVHTALYSPITSWLDRWLRTILDCKYLRTWKYGVSVRL
jgi:hypothetical protein